MRHSFHLRLVVVAATVVLAAFAAQLVGAGPAVATSPGKNGTIAFYNEDGGNIYSVRPDGTHLKKLVSDAWAPAWSPKGTQIAFTRFTGEHTCIWVMNADGTGLREVIQDAWGNVSWSPDATQLAYVKNNQNIWIANVDGSGERQLTWSTTVPNTQPAWSPDGTHIAFTAGPISDFLDEDIWLVDIDGSGLRQVTPNFHGGAFDPTWSPDGAWIAFAGYWNGDVNVWTIPSARSNHLRQITHKRGYDGDPTWSPDGTQIAFMSGRTGWGNIWTIGSNGHGTFQVTWGERDMAPDWQAIPQ